MKKSIILVVLAAMAAQVRIADAAEAGGGDEAFLQLSLTPEVALRSRDTTIRGVSLNIWGENPQHGLTLGIVNGSTGESSGFTWGAVNYTETYTGVQWAFVNLSKYSFTGWQGAAFNYAEGSFTGLQTGFLNYAEGCRGVQCGAVNYAENLDGVQIGFLNIAMNNGWFDAFPDKLANMFPFVNWSF